MSRARIIAVWWIACLLWSAGWLFIKIGVTDLPPLTFAALRLTLAFLVLSAIVTLRGEWKLLRSADVPVIAASGLLLLGLNYALTFWGAQYLPSALTSVLQATSPVFGFLIGVMTGAERFSIARGLALPAGVAGVALVSRGQFSGGTLAGWGSAAVVSGAACAALAYAIIKRRAAHIPSPLLVAMQTLFAVVPLSIVAMVIDGHPLDHRWTAAAIGALLYLAIVSSVIAFWLNYWLLKRMSTTAVLSSGLVQPLVAALLGAIVLGERFGPLAALGGALILISAAVILRKD
jgi:drug/metabolite transporter (DMT)-like permease